ncbi:MAG: hypothetical protein V2A54_09085 [Bacteroidota bacterium]
MEIDSTSPKKIIVPNVMVVLLAALSIISIFLPWFAAKGESVSLVNILSYVGDLTAFDSKANLLYLLLLIPIFSAVIIGVEMNNNVKVKLWSQIGKIIVFVINILALVGLIYVQSLLGGTKATVFEIMGYGYWIALISSVLLLITVFTRKKMN